MIYRNSPPRDYFSNLIEIGDRYFYGSPCTTGIVCSVKKTSIEIELDHPTRNVNVMKRKSPDKGICLDKIPK